MTDDAIRKLHRCNVRSTQPQCCAFCEAVRLAAASVQVSTLVWDSPAAGAASVAPRVRTGIQQHGMDRPRPHHCAVASLATAGAGTARSP